MSEFIVGNTYKLSHFIVLGLQLTIGAKFSGEDGVFTAHKVDDDGSVWTDDITSDKINKRCHIPANIISSCEVVPCK